MRMSHDKEEAFIESRRLPTKDANANDDESRKPRESSWDRASLVTKYSLSFVWPLLKFAWQNDLHLGRLERPPREDESKYLGAKLENNYQLESSLCREGTQTRRPSSTTSKFRRPSLVRALFRTFGLELLIANLFNTLTRNLLLPLQTISLGWLLRDIRLYSNLKTVQETFAATTTTTGNQTLLLEGPLYYYATSEDNKEQLTQAYSQILLDAFIIAASTCLASCSMHPFFFQTYHIGMKCRISACQLIYKKALRLSQFALNESTAGQMTNLLSNDVQRFDLVVQTVPFLVDGPLCALLISYILAKYYLGFYATASGLLVISLFMLTQGSLGKLFGKFRLRASKQADQRVQLMSEIIESIKVLKMYAWEEAFERMVQLVRARELEEIRNTFLIRALNLTSFFMSSKLIVFTMLMVYIQLGSGSLSPELIFVTIGLCNLIRITITMYLANSFAQCAEALISCKRIDEFLQLPETNAMEAMAEHRVDLLAQDSDKPSTELEETTMQKREPCAITFERLYAWWTSKKQIVIRNLTLGVKQGELVFVVGRVGSGKSSILMAILGELPIASGRLGLGGRLSFAAQDPCLFAGSIRDNILFGKDFKPERYREVIRVCCLERDITLTLPEGDQTLVGERGTSLSGGQKARVNLARALYQEADIYLLDDPLSALDGPVAWHIVQGCLSRPSGFLANKTVLLATHQLQFLKEADRVLLVDKHAPALFGTPSEVLQSPGFKLVDYAREALQEASQKSGDNAATKETEGKSEPESFEEDKKRGRHENKKEKDELKAITSESESSYVAANSATYLYYLKNCFNVLVFLWFLLAIVLAQAANLWIDYLLSRWTDSREQLETLGEDLYHPKNFIDKWTLEELTQYYGLSILFGLASTFAVCITFVFASVRASRRMHANALAKLLKAPMRYFASTPIGVVLNRMSRDLGFVDQTLPLSALEIIMILSNVTAIIALTILINFYNALVVTFLLLAAIFLRLTSLQAIARLKQLDGITRSPIFSHLSSTLNGLATIRAFKQEERFLEQFDHHQDQHSSAWFAFMCTTRWLGQAMDWISITFVSTVVIMLILFQLDSTSASLIGLLISNAIYMPGMFQAGMRQLVESESQLTSVQRIKELYELEPECKEQEKRLDRLQTASSDNRPSRIYDFNPVTAGCIKFIDVSLKYSPQDKRPVLRNLNLTIRPREKVGIVGRTGAGKSSIISALFRLYDFEGRVELDGYDTKGMTLGELRRSLAIIPQDPVLFAGSVRKNLDPLNKHSDAELWHALEAVQMRNTFIGDIDNKDKQQANNQGLEFHINEGGGNLSVGQRQLICLARAIVRRNRILVLDEATANVDPETDAFIQRTIVRQFADCTVLTIAHRLFTIVESDRILVLDRGEAIEFDEPYELLQRPNGMFTQIVNSSGAQQAPAIIRMIEQAHDKRLEEVLNKLPSTDKSMAQLTDNCSMLPGKKDLE